jgi:hypothetical protein
MGGRYSLSRRMSRQSLVHQVGRLRSCARRNKEGTKKAGVYLRSELLVACPMSSGLSLFSETNLGKQP